MEPLTALPVLTATSTSTGDSTLIAALVLVPLIAAVILVVVGKSRAEGAVPWHHRLGPPDWDFTSSWGSNLAGVAALLGTILGGSVLPKHLRGLSPLTYTVLNLAFGVLVVLAPFVFVATRVKSGDNADGSPQYEGFVWSFLLASVLTVWAVLGELAALGVLFWELGRKGTLSWGAAAPILVITIGVILTAFMYTVRTVGWTVQTAGPPTSAAPAGAEEFAAQPPPQPRAAWALL